MPKPQKKYTFRFKIWVLALAIPSPIFPLKHGIVVTADAGMLSPGGQFDFQNIIVKNLSVFLMGISCISAIEIMRKRFLPVSQIKSN